jgi:hypothetical protein
MVLPSWLVQARQTNGEQKEVQAVVDMGRDSITCFGISAPDFWVSLDSLAQLAKGLKKLR